MRPQRPAAEGGGAKHGAAPDEARGAFARRLVPKAAARRFLVHHQPPERRQRRLKHILRGTTIVVRKAAFDNSRV